MADIHFQFPVRDMTGSISHEKGLSFRTRFGKTHAYHFRNPSTEPDSEARKAHRQAFADARRRTKLELQDPQKYEYWLQLFKKQKKYVRLDCFVVAEILREAKKQAEPL